MANQNKNKVGVCPYCKHEWTYKERLLGYVIKPRSRTKCPKCGEYLEPSTMTMIYEYLALILVLIFVIFIIPQAPWLHWTKVILSAALILPLIFIFIPFSVRFERQVYNMKKK